MAKQHCQSCDMPINKDPAQGGTEADGSKTTKFCSYCYEAGTFISPETDVKAFQKMVVDNMVKEGWMRPIAWLFTRRIPQLERWKGA